MRPSRRSRLLDKLGLPKKLRQLSGQATVEYIMIIALIVIGCAGVMLAFGDEVKNTWEEATSTLTEFAGGGGGGGGGTTITPGGDSGDSGDESGGGEGTGGGESAEVAYALLVEDGVLPDDAIDLDGNSLAGEPAYAMYFVRTATEPVAGEAYASDTYGDLMVSKVYAGIEETEYYADPETGDALFPAWTAADMGGDGAAASITSITFEDEISPKSLTAWFYEFGNCTTIKGMNNLSTANVSDMTMTFAMSAVPSIEGFTVSHFDTSNVLSMYGTFAMTGGLALDLGEWDTSSVTNMNMMFAMSGWTDLDLSSFDTGNVKDMGQMFLYSSVEKLDLSSFDTSNVTTMQDMFGLTNSLKEITLGSNFSFKGACTDSNYYAYLPIPSTDYIDGADGKWYHESGNASCDPDVLTENYTAGMDGTWYAYDPSSAYAAVYGGNTLVFGRTTDGTAPATHTSDNGSTLTLSAAYDEKNGFDIEESLYINEAAVPWYADYASSITSVKFANTVHPVSTGAWFYGLSNCKTIDLSGLDVSRLSYAFSMFSGCSSLTELTLPEGFGQSKTSMEGIFANCSSLTELTLPEGFGSQCEAISYMFSGCSSLKYLSLPEGFGSQVTTLSMGSVFSGCSSLTALALPDGFGAKVTTGDMSWMFNDCSSLKYLSLPEGFGSKVTTGSMFAMFQDCTSLESITFPVDFGSVMTAGNIAQMFLNCSSLTSLDLSSMKTDQITEMQYMFEYCEKLTTIYVSGLWSTDAVTSSDHMFNACFKLKGGNGKTYTTDYADATYACIDTDETPGYLTDISDKPLEGDAYALILDNSSASANYSGTTPMVFMRAETAPQVGETYDGLPITAVYSDIETAQYYVDHETGEGIFPAWTLTDFGGDGAAASVTSVVFADEISPVSTAFWFCGMSSCASMDLAKLDTSNVTNMGYMFFACSSLTTLDGSNFVTTNVTDMYSMFFACSSLTTLDVSNFVTTNVTKMGYMFYTCSNLTTLDVSSFVTTNVTDMGSMFEGCSSLTTLDVSNFVTTNVTKMYGMFSCCSNLTTLDVSNFVTTNVTNMGSMFMSCTSLTLDCSGWDVSKVTSYNYFNYKATGVIAPTAWAGGTGITTTA